ncbi:hypothetical protein [Sessilibacter corallicola]|uniref:hypothetical protein n=1 Tax=Sessilibacter corallicola TaxID=2904075 RepID=UPI001E43B04C|nr:hypothetical protein [Sessilibacter corallicola]MCE2029293.1 hypothetical protein [Sessilibacter corallicola]
MIESVTIKDKTFNIPQASAVQQAELIQVAGGRIAFSSSKSDNAIDVNLIKGSLITIGTDNLMKIKSLVFDRIHLSGESEPVGIEFFQGQIDMFYTLLAEAIRVNLQDFFISLDNAKKGINPPSSSAVQ